MGFSLHKITHALVKTGLKVTGLEAVGNRVAPHAIQQIENNPTTAIVGTAAAVAGGEYALGAFGSAAPAAGAAEETAALTGGGFAYTPAATAAASSGGFLSTLGSVGGGILRTLGLIAGGAPTQNADSSFSPPVAQFRGNPGSVTGEVGATEAPAPSGVTPLGWGVLALLVLAIVFFLKRK